VIASTRTLTESCKSKTKRIAKWGWATLVTECAPFHEAGSSSPPRSWMGSTENSTKGRLRSNSSDLPCPPETSMRLCRRRACTPLREFPRVPVRPRRRGKEVGDDGEDERAREGTLARGCRRGDGTGACWSRVEPIHDRGGDELPASWKGAHSVTSVARLPRPPAGAREGSGRRRRGRTGTRGNSRKGVQARRRHRRMLCIVRHRLATRCCWLG
jgi:hypothetical protein